MIARATLAMFADLTWRHAALWPAAAIALGLALWLVWGAYRLRRAGGTSPLSRTVAAACRFAAFVALALIWLGPARSESPDPAPRDEARPRLTVLIDASGSMAEGDGAPRSRLARLAATWLEGTVWRAMTDAADVALYRFSDNVTPMHVDDLGALTPDAGAPTGLLDAIKAVMAKDPAALDGGTFLLLTDGHETVRQLGSTPRDAFADAAATLATRDITAFAPDLDAFVRAPARPTYAIAASTPADTVFAGEPVHIDTLVTRRDGARDAHEDADRDADASPLTVDLELDGRTVEQATFTFEPGQTVRTIRFEHTPEVPAGPVLPIRATPANSASDNAAPHHSAPDRAGPDDAVASENTLTSAAPPALLYTVRLSTPTVDASPPSHAHALVVRYLGRPIRVLLLEGEPGWPSRYLIDALRRDRQIDLTAVQAISGERTLVLRSGRANADTRTRADPLRADATGKPLIDQLAASPTDVLRSFDAVLLGRRVDRLIAPEQADALRSYVESGGGLWLTRGDPYSASPEASTLVREISPVAWGERIVGPLKLTLAERARPDGSRDGNGAEFGFDPGDSATLDLEALPMMLAGTRSVGQRSATVVLMRQRPFGSDDAERSAAVAYQRLGTGRVMATMTEGLWRWAMLPPRLDAYRAAYDSLMAGLLRRVALGSSFEARRTIQLDASPINATVGTPVRVTVRCRFIAPDALVDRVRVEARPVNGGSNDTADPIAIALRSDPADPTAAVGTFTPQVPGRADLTADAPDLNATTPRLPIVVQPAADESSDPTPRPDWVAALVEGTGGAMLDGSDVGPLIEHLEQRARALSGTDQSERTTDGDAPEPIWDRAWVFVPLIGLLTLEWFIRRGGGMP